MSEWICGVGNHDVALFDCGTVEVAQSFILGLLKTKHPRTVELEIHTIEETPSLVKVTVYGSVFAKQGLEDNINKIYNFVLKESAN